MSALRHIAGFGAIFLAASLAAAAEVDSRIPADTEIVVSVNVAQLFNSPLGAKYLRTAVDEALKHNAEGQEALNYLGLDPMRDITQLTLAMTSAKNKEGVVIIRGRFNRAKIDDLAQKVAAEQKDKLAIHNNGTATVYEITGEKKMFATFPDDSTLLVSMDRARLASPAGRPKSELLLLIAKADGKQAIWFVASPDATNEIKSSDDVQKKLLDSLVGVIGVVRLESSIRLEVALISKTSQSAAAAGKQINDLISLVKLMAPQAVKEKPELSPLVEVINSIHTAARDKLVVISAEFSAEQVEKAIKSYRSSK
jgi:hypothetical protein